MDLEIKWIILCIMSEIILRLESYLNVESANVKSTRSKNVKSTRKFVEKNEKSFRYSSSYNQIKSKAECKLEIEEVSRKFARKNPNVTFSAIKMRFIS